MKLLDFIDSFYVLATVISLVATFVIFIFLSIAKIITLGGSHARSMFGARIHGKGNR